MDMDMEDMDMEMEWIWRNANNMYVKRAHAEFLIRVFVRRQTGSKLHAYCVPVNNDEPIIEYFN